MRTLIDFAIRTEYSRFKGCRDGLCEIGSQIDWERFRFLEPLLYKNKTSRGGRPNIDIVIMVKLLVLQHWFGLSDPELEWQVADRFSFRIFLGTTEVVPDLSTVWLFRERLIKSSCTILCCLNETIRSFQDTIADFSFNIIVYTIPVLFYGFGAIDYSIESTVCCPEIPSLKIFFSRRKIYIIPKI